MRSLRIGSKDTAKDWDLILTNIAMEQPQPKTEYIDIPLGNGAIDMTEALTGQVNYHNRKGKVSFDLIIAYKDREKRLAEISSYVHGKRHKIYFPDNDEYYMFGRISIQSLKREGMLTQFVMAIEADPFLYNRDITTRRRTLTDKLVNTNLVLGSHLHLERNTYELGQYLLSSKILTDKKYKISFIGDLDEIKRAFGVFNSGSSYQLVELTRNDENKGLFMKEFIGKEWGSSTMIRFFQKDVGTNGTSRVERIMLTSGDRAEEWSPSPNDFGSVTFAGMTTFKITNLGKPVIPEITVSAEMTMLVNGKTYTISAGTHKTTGLILYRGVTYVSFAGAIGATAEIKYQGGVL